MRLLYFLYSISLFVLIPVRADFIPPPCAVYEVRTYQAKEGKMAALLELFRGAEREHMFRRGILTLLILSPSESPDTTLTCVYGYFNLEDARRSWKAIRERSGRDKKYQNLEAPGDLVSQIDTVIYQATAYSPKWQTAGPFGCHGFIPEAAREKEQNARLPELPPARLFEQRTYTSLPGKLEALDAYFKDRGLGQFKKQGIDNLLFLHPMKGQPGHGTTITCFLAHQDDASRTASFVALAAGKDAMADLSKEVKSTVLAPSDLSTLR